MSRRDDVTVVRPAGELDLATVGVLDDRLHELAAEGATALVVDLSGLTFIDSTGIKLLLGWQRLAIELGLSFELVPGRDAVRRTLAISGADTLLRFRDAPALETPLQT
ncbi:MAG TPA: STAS domain-containing protein [Solirubrobacteraceae bacterium]